MPRSLVKLAAVCWIGGVLAVLISESIGALWSKWSSLQVSLQLTASNASKTQAPPRSPQQSAAPPSTSVSTPALEPAPADPANPTRPAEPTEPAALATVPAPAATAAVATAATTAAAAATAPAAAAAAAADQAIGLTAAAAPTTKTPVPPASASKTTKAFYQHSDTLRFTQWSQDTNWAQRSLHQTSLPRVLLYSWYTSHGPSTLASLADEAHKRSCYAHAHGFDVVFSSVNNVNDAKKMNVPGSGDQHLLSDGFMWAWVQDIQQYLRSGKYDYVFMMVPNASINDVHMSFPIWEYDMGHDVTVMDQHKINYGFILNGVLFRASQGALNFLKEMFDYRLGFYVMGDNGAYMETILNVLGRESRKKGQAGYLNTCLPQLQMDISNQYMMTHDSKTWSNKVHAYCICFFNQLDLLAGGYGIRVSKAIGFSRTFVSPDGKSVLLYEDLVNTDMPLMPLANCFDFTRKFWKHPGANCFAFNWNERAPVPVPSFDPTFNFDAIFQFAAKGSCIDPTFDWYTSPYFSDWEDGSQSNGTFLFEGGVVTTTSSSAQSHQQPQQQHQSHSASWLFYGPKDSLRFAEWSQHSKDSGYPRVLLYSWGTEATFVRFVDEVYWKQCYASAHGFDVVFRNVKDIRTIREEATDIPLLDKFLSQWYSNENLWIWATDVPQYFSGDYDYVFVVGPDVLINVVNMDFPVWAYDTGHDITVMDQRYVGSGLNFNGVLFKTSPFSRMFFDEYLSHMDDFLHLGLHMEIVLKLLGTEAEEAGLPGYEDRCLQHAKLHTSFHILMQNDLQFLKKKQEQHSQCFFQELDRLAGVYGKRVSKHIGFSPTYRYKRHKLDYYSDLLNTSKDLSPWANCFDDVRTFGPNPTKNCFAFHRNGETYAKAPSDPKGQCPDPNFKWSKSEYNPLNRFRNPSSLQMLEAPLQKSVSAYLGAADFVSKEDRKILFRTSDCTRYLQWSGRRNDSCASMPRVLLLAWVTEDTYTNFRNEMYWKACYAHAHGFDLMLTDELPKNTDTGDAWYSKERLWGWWTILRENLALGKWHYDYVFITGADVEIVAHWLHFPVWAFDAGGTDLSFMDQCYSDWGLNDNAFLFKNSNWSIDFLTAGLAYKEKYVIQADNGGYMEQILKALGTEAEARGEAGYEQVCYPHLLLPEPVPKLLKSNPQLYVQKNGEYSKCFFAELERLAGPYNMRTSKHIGFNPVRDAAAEPDENVPWANCWSHLRMEKFNKPCIGNMNWLMNCFTLHWNGLQKLQEGFHSTVQGECPDPTFNWELSPYNTKNRGKAKAKAKGKDKGKAKA